MKFAMSLVAIAGLAAAANAAQSTLAWQVSVNGGTFGNSANAAAGDTLTFRLRVSYDAVGGTGSTIAAGGGLAGFNFLPTLSNFGSNDTAIALGNESFPTGSPGNPLPLTAVNHPDLGVVNVYTGALPIPGRHGPGAVGGATGRQAPFAANGTNANGKATSNVAAGVLTWRAGVIGDAGVSVAQLNANNSGISAPVLSDNGTPEDTSDDFIDFGASGGSFASSGRSNVVVFTYSVLLGESLADRTMIGSASPLTPVQWFTSASGNSASHDGVAVTAIAASVFVPGVPAPGALALLGLGGLVATRRRR